MDEGVEDNSFMLILDHLKGDESSRQWSLIMGFLWCGGVMGKYAAGELKPPSTDGIMWFQVLPFKIFLSGFIHKIKFV
ncbi:hypothetical protein CK203_034608 [Vitis vinifera]|uniref:Uncharacterized protein n=1 Tax=Vitis vinifera TaxID=29760 RepID=A0A438IDL7_VITVI|nr:hypothetical protein CK203_034608 [Vitis vinifera]